MNRIIKSSTLAAVFGLLLVAAAVLGAKPALTASAATATIGNTPGSFQTALDNADNDIFSFGGGITFAATDKYEIDRDITLRSSTASDTRTLSVRGTDPLFTVKEGGTLTIEYRLTFSAGIGANASGTVVLVEDGGTLIIDAGSAGNTSIVGGADYPAICVRSGGRLEIKNGTVTGGTSCAAVKAENGATVAVSGGVLTGNGQTAIEAENFDKIHITGGTFNNSSTTGYGLSLTKGKIEIPAQVTIRCLYIDGAVVSVSGTLTANGSTPALTVASGCVNLSGTASGSAGANNYAVAVTGGMFNLQPAGRVTGGNGSGSGGHGGGGIKANGGVTNLSGTVTGGNGVTGSNGTIGNYNGGNGGNGGYGVVIGLDMILSAARVNVAGNTLYSGAGGSGGTRTGSGTAGNSGTTPNNIITGFTVDSNALIKGGNGGNGGNGYSSGNRNGGNGGNGGAAMECIKGSVKAACIFAEELSAAPEHDTVNLKGELTTRIICGDDEALFVSFDDRVGISGRFATVDAELAAAGDVLTIYGITYGGAMTQLTLTVAEFDIPPDEDDDPTDENQPTSSSGGGCGAVAAGGGNMYLGLAFPLALLCVIFAKKRKITVSNYR